MNRADMTFYSQGLRCAAWHYRAESDALTTPSGRPCAVMAHGFGATRDGGLDGFASGLAAAGIDTLVFDYRGFGASEGSRRQYVDIDGQLDDYRSALAFARKLDGIDPDRLVLWGVSLSGGHVLRIAAEDTRIAATVALTPAVDGMAALRGSLRRDGLWLAARTTATAVRDLIAAARRRPAVLIPLTGPPGSVAALTAPGTFEAYTAVAGPTWRNEFVARNLLDVGTYRPRRYAEKVSHPLLVQVADLDQTAPPWATMAAANRVPLAEVRHYPCDHFDIYPGRQWHQQALKHQIAFLTRHLASSATAVEGAETVGADT
jgi:uncharacterized protein